MRVVILMRHGKSDWTPLGVSDFNRPLSERGIREALAQAQALLKEGYRPDLILSSPALRAWHTAHLVAQASSLPHAAVQPNIGFYEEDPQAVYLALDSLPNRFDTVVFVGHNPLWSQLASQWSGENIELATSELVVFALEGVPLALRSGSATCGARDRRLGIGALHLDRDRGR